MAFTFQINDDVEFKHDQRLLEKAIRLTPPLQHQKVVPCQLVKLCNDPTKLDGVGVVKNGELADLKERKFARDDQVILDFGNHYVGQFKLKLTHVGSPQDAPLTLRIRFAEVPAELSYQASDYQGWLSKSWIQEEIVHFDELPATLKLPRRYAFRYVELTVIDTSPKWAVQFKQPEVITESSADPTKLPSVKLADPELQRIYEVSVKTLQDCMQEVFEDGPKRDRRLWLGDLRLQALANYATFDNRELVKRCLYLFAAMTAKDGRIVANVFTKPNYVPDDTFLFDYSLFFISTLADYYRHTKDQEALADLLPVATAQMEIALTRVNDQGGYQEDEAYPVFIDWSNEFDKTTAGQGVLILALRQLITLLQAAAQPTERYVASLQQLVTYAQEQFFDAQQDLFVSGAKREINVASQVWMVLAGVVTGDQVQVVMRTMIKQLFPIRGIATPYMYHHVVEALFMAGLNDEAVALLKHYWGKMLALGADTYWEAFDPDQPDYSPYGSPIVSSYCHAWSCTPAYLIQKYLTEEA